MSEDQATSIVGIGASAGGLGAFRRLLGSLPADSGAAFVLVQHLEATRDSVLVDLLAGSTLMPVTEIANKTRPLPNRVYVGRAGHTVRLVDGLLVSSARPAGAPGHKSIDEFLVSVAQDRGAHCMGVVLSGMGTDGTRGLRSIRDAGGVTYAQTPESAEFPGMPQSAIAADVIDVIMSPEEIGTEMGRSLRAESEAGARVPVPTLDAPSLREILGLLGALGGTDFTEYKEGTFRRCIARRMSLRRASTPAEYIAGLRADPAELDALHRSCLVGVTSFFRDPGVFETAAELVARLAAHRPTDTPLRAWVAGCATGEEVWSLAIALREKTRRPLEIVGSDINRCALDEAERAVYPDSITDEVSTDRLRRFFVRVEGGYRIADDLRASCSFVIHDIAQPPTLAGLDLVTCRNVLIYLSSPLQERVLAGLHAALAPTGVLVLGAAEAVSHDQWTVFSRAHRVFLRSDIGPLPHVGDGAGPEPIPAPKTPRSRALTGDRVGPRSFAIAARLQELAHQEGGSPAEVQTLVQDLLDEHATVLEEAQVANEELRSTNDEMQRVNQELEASKEELVVAGDELATLNQELSERNRRLEDLSRQLRRSADYANGIVATVREPLVVLDDTLRIETVNRSFERTFHVAPGDTEGRLLYELGNGQWDIPELRSALAAVGAEHDGGLDDFVVEHDFPTWAAVS